MEVVVLGVSDDEKERNRVDNGYSRSVLGHDI